ncbi:MAG: tRNA (5-methylaminomethyl-2-thiouridine)(34)-methyltransferase MnmD [Sphingobacteriaceae bacterium]
MKPYLVITADGSQTLYHAEIGENYHSKHGALQESKHVFLQSGLVYLLEQYPAKAVAVLEVGLGTGLNFLLTADYCKKHHIGLNYTAIEAFPLDLELISQTGYDQFVAAETWMEFRANYELALKDKVKIHPLCELKIDNRLLQDFESNQVYDLIYFDAFAAIHQPEMWTTEALEKVCRYLKPGGVFVTYAITGNLKRSMRSLGFTIEKAPGAPGKREMLRATKLV